MKIIAETLVVGVFDFLKNQGLFVYEVLCMNLDLDPPWPDESTLPDQTSNKEHQTAELARYSEKEEVLAEY